MFNFKNWLLLEGVQRNVTTLVTNEIIVKLKEAYKKNPNLVSLQLSYDLPPRHPIHRSDYSSEDEYNRDIEEDRNTVYMKLETKFPDPIRIVNISLNITDSNKNQADGFVLGNLFHMGFFISKNHLQRNQYTDIIPKIKEAIRHELMHIYDKEKYPQKYHPWTHDMKTAYTDDRGEEEKRLSLEDIEGYYLHPKEVRAYLSGFYQRSKSTGQSFGQLLNFHFSKILNALEYVGASQDQINQFEERMRSTYSKYQNQMFPYANQPSVKGKKSVPFWLT